MPISELVQKRKSVRTYQRKSLSPETAQQVAGYLSKVKGPFDSPVRMQLLERKAGKGTERLGAYGTIAGARSFIAATTDKGPNSLLQVGYLMEDVVLFLTSIGIGTCWMAATFDQARFRNAANVAPNEILPIVTAVGYPSAVRTPVDLLVKPLVGSGRLVWSRLFFENDLATPMSLESAAGYSIPLEMLRLSPSASNKQPWRVVRVGTRYHFYLEHDAAYSKRYPYDIQKVDIGIAMFHFETTAVEKGCTGSWTQQDPTLADLPPTFEYMVSWQAEGATDRAAS